MGVDLLDVSSGGLHPKQKIKPGPGYQAPFAKAVKEKLGDKLAVATVGTITSGKQANQLLEEGLDLTIVGRMFQKNQVWCGTSQKSWECRSTLPIKFVGASEGDLARQRGRCESRRSGNVYMMIECYDNADRIEKA